MSRDKRNRHIAGVAAVMAIGLVLAGCGSSSPDSDDDSGDTKPMVVTFVRHAESKGNASDYIHTNSPGPVLSKDGERQAQQAAEKLTNQDFDCVYSSPLTRAKQTAKPTAEGLGESVEELTGLREIEAGAFESESDDKLLQMYMKGPLQWANGSLEARIPGSINGAEFNERVTAALTKIQAAGCRRPVVFSHGGTIMTWTIMNADGADLDLLTDDELEDTDLDQIEINGALDNTEQVEVEGTPKDGWKLNEWSGSGSL